MSNTASSLMSRRVHTVTPAHSCARAWATLQASSARWLVVVAPFGEGVVGLLSERMLLAVSTADGSSRAFRAPLSVAEVMALFPRCVSPSATLRELCEEFLEHGLEAAPVVADDGELVGLVTTQDLLRTLYGGGNALSRAA